MLQLKAARLKEKFLLPAIEEEFYVIESSLNLAIMLRPRTLE
jgi:hypothetical protein